jgi:hypothetical protein
VRDSTVANVSCPTQHPFLSTLILHISLAGHFKGKDIAANNCGKKKTPQVARLHTLTSQQPAIV